MNPLYNNILKRLRIAAKRAIPELRKKNLTSDPALLNLAEAPYHGVTKALDQFKGKAGLKNLGLGALTGGGLYTGSQMLDEDNDTLSSALGSLGLVAPGMFRGGRAGLKGMRDFLNAARSLGSRGVTIMSADESKRRATFLRNFLNRVQADPKKVLDILRNPNSRKELLSVIRPDDTVKINFLTNQQGSIDAMMPHLAAMSKNFGRSILDAGTIINPNIAARVEKGSLQKALASMGYKKLLGQAQPVQNVGAELHTALKDRFVNLSKKNVNLNKKYKDLTKDERKSLLPDDENFFPLSLDVKGEKLTLLDALKKRDSNSYYGSRRRSGYEEDLSRYGLSNSGNTYMPNYSPWQELSNETRDWLSTQNINSQDAYDALTRQVNTFYGHARDSAKKNPRQYIENFKLPSLRHISQPGSEYRDIAQDLTALARSVNN